MDFGKYKEDSNKGMILEVDLHPLACEKVKVTNSMLSKYCERIAEKFNIKCNLVSKLVPMLFDKERYITHYRNLQLYLNLGLKIKKYIESSSSINPLGSRNTLISTPINEKMPKMGLKKTSLNSCVTQLLVRSSKIYGNASTSN